jgi:predicted dithiol-disulfide oxidoreductase (DUF899 family)
MATTNLTTNQTTSKKGDQAKVVGPAEWLAARKEFLRKEKEFTRLRDELSRQRRALPWERVEKNCSRDPGASRRWQICLADAAS